MKCLRLQTQEKKNQVSSKLMLGKLFPIITFFFMLMIFQILTSVKEITLNSIFNDFINDFVEAASLLFALNNDDAAL